MQCIHPLYTFILMIYQTISIAGYTPKRFRFTSPSPLHPPLTLSCRDESTFRAQSIGFRFCATFCLYPRCAGQDTDMRTLDCDARNQG